MKYRGICSTCDYALTCSFPKDPDLPVYFCEEFETRGQLSTEIAGHDSLVPVKPSTPGQPAEKDRLEYQGLCSDCAHRSSCIYLKPEGGVWHCEEYQVQTLEIKTPVQCKKEIDPSQIRRIVDGHRGKRGDLIATLEEIQSEHGYLPQEALRMVAESNGHSLVDIFGVATFYRSFSLKPRGRHLICTCMGTACHVRGSPMVLEEFERQLGIHSGETTPDGEYTLDTVNCLGACALGPVVVVKGEYHPNVSAPMVKRIVKKAMPREAASGV